MALIALVTLVASLFLTAAVRAIARRWGIVDRPDGRRKLHGRPTALWGGVAVYGAAVLGLLAVRFGMGDVSAEFTELATTWMITAGCVCFIGAIDDHFDLPSRVKLALQIISVLPIVLFGYDVNRIEAFGYPVDLGWLGIPLTALWLVGCINALNLIDGMDGLASIVGLSAAAMLGAIAASEGHMHVALMALVLSASLLGFLIYNLPPASIFLGDSGSMVIGLSVGLLGIQGTLKTSATLAITAPAVVMVLPMFDIVAALVRRRLTGRRFDSPDRLHIHHRLLDRGWSPWQVLFLVGTLCLTTGVAATAAAIFRRDAFAWITALTLVVLMIRLRLFGYEEFALLKRASVRTFKRGFGFLAGHARLEEADNSRLWAREEAATAECPEAGVPTAALWDVLLRHVRTWDIHQVEFRSLKDHQSRRIRWIDPAMPVGETCGWSLSVSLPDLDGDLCELRTTSPHPIIDQHDLAALTSLLKTFGDHFAAHSEQLFGPTVLDVPLVISTYDDTQRKAA